MRADRSADAIVMQVLDREPTTLLELESLLGRTLDRDPIAEARALIRTDFDGFVEIEVKFLDEGENPRIARMTLVTRMSCHALARRLFGDPVQRFDDHEWSRGHGVFSCDLLRRNQLEWRHASEPEDEFTWDGPHVDNVLDNDRVDHAEHDEPAGIAARVRGWLANRRR